MTCPEATGACSITHDGLCTELKVLDPSLTLEDIFLQGTADGLTLSWYDGVSSTDTVTYLLRTRDGEELSSRVVVDFDDGYFTATGLDGETLYSLWVRREDTDSFGDWEMLTALTSTAWNMNSEIVEHHGDVAYQGADVVLIG